MGVIESLRGFFTGNSQYQHIHYIGPTVSQVLGMGPEELFRTQPHLRTVITFIARNIAQLPLQTFVRVSDGDRVRDRQDPVARLLSQPNPDTTQYELMYGTIADLKLYDLAIWAIVPSSEAPSGWQIRQIPPMWVMRTGGGTVWSPEWVEIVAPNHRGGRTILRNEPGSPRQFLLFHGYRPGDPSGYVSPVDSLKEILSEQISAWIFRQQMWTRGGRVGTFISRPAGAEWSDEARQKFARDWKDKWSGNHGSSAGGTPILEDGMTLQRVAFTSREQEWSEVAKLSLSTVAAVYHTSPTMVGVLDNANYSNVREFKTMLYTDTLGPDLAMIEDRLNTFLVPAISDSPDIYVEFNVDEKLQGNFEEQAAVMTTSVGGPWMTRNEARARRNLPALPGGDSLIVPLNVLIGGQSSPNDGGSSQGFSAGPVLTRGKTENAVCLKGEPRPADEKSLENVMRRFFKRQRDAVLKKINSKATPEWWDEVRWNHELAADLFELAKVITAEIGADTMKELGMSPDAYDVDRTAKFLMAVSESRASGINRTTMEKLIKSLDGGFSDDAVQSTPEGVFEDAEEHRSGLIGTTLATTLVGFATGEAATQLDRPNTTKTWIVTSANPRSSHAALDGETVPVDQTFSNGAMWPGDAVLDVDEVAGCMCGVEITIP